MSTFLVAVVLAMAPTLLLSMPFIYLPEIRGPCSVIIEEMHYSGYTVRDCTYLDPFVYWRIEYRMSWEGARSACQQIPGGDLVSIHGFDEKQVVNAMAENNYFNLNLQPDLWPWDGVDQGVWIGLVDREKSGKGWEWVDGSEYDYKDWLSMEPDQGSNNKEHCAQLISVTRQAAGAVAKGWNDIGCRWGMKAICKAPRVAVFP